MKEELIPSPDRSRSPCQIFIAANSISQNEITLYKPVVKKWDGGKEPVPAKSDHAEHTIGKQAALGTSGEAAPHQTQAKRKSKSKPKVLAKKTK